MSAGRLHADVMTTTEAPLYLAGHLAPVPDEISVVDLPVDGRCRPS